MGHKIAVVGATGNVGQEILDVLAARSFPADEVFAVASASSEGSELEFGEQTLKVESLDKFDFSKVDIALSSAGGAVAAEFAPKAAAAGAIVIDNSSHFRTDPQVPLIVPEVNSDAIAGYTAKNIIANPNCSTIQMVLALKPLHDLATIKRVVVSTYQSVSGGGRASMEELFDQSRAIFSGEEVEPKVFTKQMAFNVIPQIDVFMEDGRTKEEWKMDVETKKIMSADFSVCANCVRVPVFVGHAEMVNIEFEHDISEEEARDVLSRSPGLGVVDNREDGGYVTPVEIAGEDATVISRLRKDASAENALNMWIVSDNLRKGAALNAVQIAEVLVRDYI